MTMCRILVAASLCMAIAGCFGHPYPINEIYEVREPETDRSVIQFATYLWPGDDVPKYLPNVRFRDLTGTIWQVENWLLNWQKQPPQWVEYRVYRKIMSAQTTRKSGEPATRFPVLSRTKDEPPKHVVAFVDTDDVRWVVIVGGTVPEQWAVHRIAASGKKVLIPIKKVYSDGGHPWHPSREDYPWPVFEK